MRPTQTNDREDRIARFMASVAMAGITIYLFQLVPTPPPIPYIDDIIIGFGSVILLTAVVFYAIVHIYVWFDERKHR